LANICPTTRPWPISALPNFNTRLQPTQSHRDLAHSVLFRDLGLGGRAHFFDTEKVARAIEAGPLERGGHRGKEQALLGRIRKVHDRDLRNRRLELDDVRRLELLDVGLLARRFAKVSALRRRLEDLFLEEGLGRGALERRHRDRVISVRHHDGVDLLLALGVEARVVVAGDGLFVLGLGGSFRHGSLGHGHGTLGLARALGGRRTRFRADTLRVGRLCNERIHFGRKVREGV
jgi:hypothetical protein